MLERFQRVCLSFNMKTDLKEVHYSEIKDICREIKTFEFIRGSYFIWKPSYIFLSICSCIILSDFSNYGNRTRKIQTAVHTLTPFLKEKNNKLVMSTPKKRKQRQHVNFLCELSLARFSLFSSQSHLKECHSRPIKRIWMRNFEFTVGPINSTICPSIDFKMLFRNDYV